MSPQAATVIIAFFVVLVMVAGCIVYVVMDPDRLKRRDEERIERARGPLRTVLQTGYAVVRLFRASFWGFMIAGIGTLGALGAAVNNWFIDWVTVRGIVQDVIDLVKWLVERFSPKDSVGRSSPA